MREGYNIIHNDQNESQEPFELKNETNYLYETVPLKRKYESQQKTLPSTLSSAAGEILKSKREDTGPYRLEAAEIKKRLTEKANKE